MNGIVMVSFSTAFQTSVRHSSELRDPFGVVLPGQASLQVLKKILEMLNPH